MDRENSNIGKDENRSKARQEFFLPVHGYVKLFAEELAIIDHPAFQRLRRVRQLGFAHMVYPGAVHTRFEHSIGSVHVAQRIIDHVNENFRSRSSDGHGSEWRLAQIDEPTQHFIRLAALLHDIGHLPFGHTLEDELNHLPHHDGRERIQRVAERPYEHYEVDKSLSLDVPRPESGWTLKDLVNRLYDDFAKKIGLELKPFEILIGIICKSKEEAESNRFPFKVCRDMVGNTICADFLDYLCRDWHHIGKPLYEDARLYQYMETRERGKRDSPERRFVINVGASEKIRHDALTSILDLLSSRYKLAETVLFHRTKLAVIGLLDRALLEIRELYQRIGVDAAEFKQAAEGLLLESSDDALPLILRELAEGGSPEVKEKLEKALKHESEELKKQLEQGAVQPSDAKLFDREESHSQSRQVSGELRQQRNLIYQLIDRLGARDIHTLIYKLRMSDFTGEHNPDNSKLKEIIKLYADPANRRRFLRGIEELCSLPHGSLVMYCPPDATMNAKVAKVNLYIEGEVVEFDQYETNKSIATSLTRGALNAQIDRFYELWSTQVYIRRECWEPLSEEGKKHLKSIVGNVLYVMKKGQDGQDPKILRQQLEPSIDILRKEEPVAARSQAAGSELEAFEDRVFPSGIPFARG